LPPIEVQQLPPAASDDAELMERITDLINDVYAVAEDGLWVKEATRTTVTEVADLTRAGQIVVARLGAGSSAASASSASTTARASSGCSRRTRLTAD
jgi:hypothetical protein